MKNVLRTALAITFVISSTALAVAQGLPRSPAQPQPRVIIISPRPVHAPPRVVIMAPRTANPSGLIIVAPRPQAAQVRPPVAPSGGAVAVRPPYAGPVLPKTSPANPAESLKAWRYEERMKELRRGSDAAKEALKRETDRIRNQQQSLCPPPGRLPQSASVRPQISLDPSLQQSIWTPPFRLPESPQASPRLQFDAPGNSASDFKGFDDTGISTPALTVTPNSAASQEGEISSLVVVGTQGDVVILSDGHGNYYRVLQKGTGKAKTVGR